MPTAVVTGASSGIGAATARSLSAAGFHVFCVARRTERIEPLAAEIGGTAVTCDVTDESQVAALAETVGPSLDLLVNNAGGAIGTDHVAVSDPDDWRRMYEVNVVGTLLVTRALLPALVASGAGTLLNLGSIAGHTPYVGGGGYVAAKHGVAAMTETLRLELNGQPVRVTEIAPGMVRTDEFSLNRFSGDADKADSVYAGVREPLVAEDIADAITWVATRPQHVNVDLMVLKPLAQAASWKVHREG
ncbi:SDR family NAD(P)-dependent oxidoreductase [Aeromicrobium sp. SMF47]|uniref:SDR family NAD(P)-dependent oxidoreductase n=1 Tax=Aeromicrobium yanjiei TaxID=2662028 RepID=A0A5Q2MBB5_9ACTN|nr:MULTISPECIES: SDR family NAD(P)-dependent oxidoreductase [Aeromicrobium]MRJ75160.1 SDR family NAD(P)-dependent oxidoreductase [Aeromicrobium yanjiei]MRK02783.1 SDR family NAD(P)-dependent oxidoreductase [Aeromicrobium sp. S22]QGG40384.1 SDR family NAD(P)-dependent oxidoreductase [Aeromicrobium yanjiei]